MIAWTPVPDPVAWPLAKPIMHNGVQYDTLTIGAPTSEDVLKASAVPGASGLDVTLRMIESASMSAARERRAYSVIGFREERDVNSAHGPAAKAMR